MNMYDPVDRHGWVTWVYSPNEERKRLNKKINELKKENTQLKHEIEELKRYNSFILEGVVRHYDEELEKKQN